ncbi:hypothetical protein [Paracidobacterium acidisoli]|uniref:Uncharacterized protein n=1 Tax=Paracidobacterium acidisoli TaxID=2303751 RepID=A0A372ISL0_9BACT|nr:hypothetical protein [Paracidobacterium acidisoli]MBT9330824.1 hypothetical protein [Paracidobacterium acidisoli]
MLRRFAWPVLLLLLMSMQTAAGVCAVQCDAMAGAAAHGPMSGMEHCHAMTSSSFGTGRAVHAPACCRSMVCRGEMELLQKQTVAVTRSSAPVFYQDALSRYFGTPASRDARLLRSAPERGDPATAQYDPLTSSLRV